MEMQAVTQQNSKFMETLKRAGPAFITTTTVFGPASLLLAGVAGATYRYECIWVLWLLFLERYLFLDLGTRVGARINSNGGIFSVFKERWNKPVSMIAAFLTGIIVMIYTAGNVLGTATATKLIFGGNLVVWAVVFMFVVIGLFFLKKVYSALEKISIFFMLVMFASFLITLLISGFSAGEFIKGLVPTLRPGSLLLGLALFLTNCSEQGIRHTFMVQEKGFTEEEAKSNAKTDHLLSTIFVVLIVGMIMSTAAEVLNPAGIIPKSAPEFAAMLEPLAGSAAKIVFAIGLFGAAFTSLTGAPSSVGLCFTDGLGKLNNGMKTKLSRAIAVATILIMGMVAVIPVATGTPMMNIYLFAALATFVAMPLNGYLMLTLAYDKKFMGNLVYSKASIILRWSVFLFVMAFALYNFITKYIL